MRHLEKRPNSKEDVSERRRLMAERFLEEHQSLESGLAVAADQKSDVYSRGLGLLAALVRAIPATRPAVLQMLRRKHDFSELPIDPTLYGVTRRINAGYWSEVFMLESKRDDLPNMVYKIEYPKSRYDTDTLLKVAKQYRNEYLSLKEGYGELPNLIPETHYMIMKSPRTGQPAVASLQTYAGVDAFDGLAEKNKERLHALMDSEPEFKKEFEQFRERTLSLASEEREPDVAGEGNILVVKQGNRHALRLVDPHGVSMEGNQDFHERQAKKLEYLRTL